MLGHTGTAEAKGAEQTPATSSLEKLLSVPLPPPSIRVRPWWFPTQELSDPLVFYLDGCLVDEIFGPNQTIIPEMEWMCQALLKVDMVDSGNLAEITVFGRPHTRNRVKSILLSLASWHRELRLERAKKIKQLEEFLKSQASSLLDTPQHPV